MEVRRSGVITARLVAQLYGISDNEVLVCRAYKPALSFKITIRRPVSSDDFGESDVYGCQQQCRSVDRHRDSRQPEVALADTMGFPLPKCPLFRGCPRPSLG